MNARSTALDHETSLAAQLLRAARARYGRCPSAENARRVAGALAEVDRLLDARLEARAGRCAGPERAA
jgi:hypothetical protein